jgi:hypothetical protein
LEIRYQPENQSEKTLESNFERTEVYRGMVSCGPTHRQKKRVVARAPDITAAVAEEKGHG